MSELDLELAAHSLSELHAVLIGFESHEGIPEPCRTYATKKREENLMLRPFRAFVIVCTLALTALAVQAQESDAAGRWQGAIELPQGELRVTVVLEKANAAWSGTIDIPVQNVRGFVLSEVSVEGGGVHFEMGGVPGQPTFHGELSEDGSTIAGTFRQGGQQLPFSVSRADGESEDAASSDPGLPETPIPGEGIVGDWLGALRPGSATLRLALHVEETPDGTLSAVLDSVDQGAVIPVDSVTLDEDGRVRLELKRIGGRFAGTMNEDGSAMEGTWHQGGRQLPLTFHRRAERFALKRPQEPEGPFPYSAHEVTFPSAAGEVTLAGTLLIPEGGGPFPAVAFVSGSGAQDRDEALMGHKPFLVIADFLARRGIASLRFDDRGMGESTGDHVGSTIQEFAGDVDGAVAFLASRSEIDHRAIGVLGHSEGGVTGPMAAVGDSEIDFLVLLAPPAVPLPSLLARQGRDVLRLQGVDDELIDRLLASQAEDLALVADESLDAEELEKRLRARAQAYEEEFNQGELARLGVNEQTLESGIRVSTTPWFRSLVRVDPAEHLREIDVPVLALFGERDVQVAAEENAAALRKALAAGGNPEVDVRILPGLNHLFQTAVTGGVEEYGAIEETIAPAALEAIGDWIEARFGDLPPSDQTGLTCGE